MINRLQQKCIIFKNKRENVNKQLAANITKIKCSSL